MPYRIYGQHIEYLWRAPSIVSWEEAYKNGECNDIQSVFWNTKPAEELYNTENDPWEIHNLVDDPTYNDVLERMRTASKDWSTRIYDTGFIPEADQINRSIGIPVYDYMRSGEVKLDEIIEAAEIATRGDQANLGKMFSYLENNESAIRYWGATGLLLLGDKTAASKEMLKTALNDESPNVVVVAAEALYKAGEIEPAKKALLKVLKDQNIFARCHALNAIESIENSSSEIIDGTIEMIKKLPEFDKSRYDLHAARGLLEKWEIDPSEYNIGFDW
jgi:hypothetical protein